MGLKEDFTLAADEVKQLSSRPSNEDLLRLYAFFKQATDGDVSGTRPGMLDVKGRKKYDSWAAQKGTPSEKAMQQYISLVQKLKAADSK